MFSYTFLMVLRWAILEYKIQQLCVKISCISEIMIASISLCPLVSVSWSHSFVPIMVYHNTVFSFILNPSDL